MSNNEFDSIEEEQRPPRLTNSSYGKRMHESNTLQQQHQHHQNSRVSIHPSQSSSSQQEIVENQLGSQKSSHKSILDLSQKDIPLLRHTSNTTKGRTAANKFILLSQTNPLERVSEILVNTSATIDVKHQLSPESSFVKYKNSQSEQTTPQTKVAQKPKLFSSNRDETRVENKLNVSKFKSNINSGRSPQASSSLSTERNNNRRNQINQSHVISKEVIPSVSPSTSRSIHTSLLEKKFRREKASLMIVQQQHSFNSRDNNHNNKTTMLGSEATTITKGGRGSTLGVHDASQTQTNQNQSKYRNSRDIASFDLDSMFLKVFNNCKFVQAEEESYQQHLTLKSTRLASTSNPHNNSLNGSTLPFFGRLVQSRQGDRSLVSSRQGDRPTQSRQSERPTVSRQGEQKSSRSILGSQLFINLSDQVVEQQQQPSSTPKKSNHPNSDSQRRFSISGHRQRIKSGIVSQNTLNIIQSWNAQEGLSEYQLLSARKHDEIKRIVDDAIKNVDEEHFRSVTPYLFEILSIATDTNDLRLFETCVEFLADLAYEMNDMNAACFFYEQSRIVYTYTKNHAKKAKVLLCIARCARSVQVSDDARVLLKKGLQYAWISNERDIELEIYDEIGRNYYFEGEIQKAEHYHLKYINGECQPDDSLDKRFSEENLRSFLNQIEFTFTNVTSLLLTYTKLPLLTLDKMPQYGNIIQSNYDNGKTPRANIDPHNNIYLEKANVKNIIQKLLKDHEFFITIQSPKSAHVAAGFIEQKSRIDRTRFRQQKRIYDLSTLGKVQTERNTADFSNPFKYKVPLAQKIEFLNMQRIDPNVDKKLQQVRRARFQSYDDDAIRSRIYNNSLFKPPRTTKAAKKPITTNYRTMFKAFIIDYMDRKGKQQQQQQASL